MLYKHSKDKKLDKELFKNPKSEYRGAPFWGWNCELEEDELLRQIDIFKKMGFGGFHIHPRSGMRTEYLGNKFMKLVKSCVKKSKEENMLTWLYDEDRWASGSAGGYVTSIKKFRQRVILFTINPRPDEAPRETAIENGLPYLIKIFDVCLNDDGTMKSYNEIGRDDAPKGVKWYIYSTNQMELGWYNGNTYVDTLNPEAIDKFIEVTHEAYLREVGEAFGKTIPAIFTDEPAHSDMDQLAFAHDTNDITLSWTHDFDESFLLEYGFDIKEKLPELVWNLEDNKISRARYAYHNHVCDRFNRAFIAKMGKWCDEHGIYLTGHMAEEDSLIMQTRLVSEEMRAYPYFGIPGIDMLCDKVSLTTLKQAQSIVHQYGKEGMMAEHCGVTNWDFSFSDHKFHIDWLMALGVTARAHHGSWVSAKGCSKRDYPASINYHSPWHEEYSFIENHASRLATVLTRGKPIVKVGIIHPIESMWLCFGAQENNSLMQKKLDDDFKTLASELLFGTIDFNYISEALLEENYGGSCNSLFNVGEMKYSAVIVPECITLRKSTVEKLYEFKKNGGKLIFAGKCPDYIDALPSKNLKALYEDSHKVFGDKSAILSLLKEERELSIFNANGKPSDNLIYNLREDGEFKWLFIAHAVKDKGIKQQNIKIKLNGEYSPVLYDTLTGETVRIPYCVKNGYTYISYSLYAFDSLLIRLEDAVEKEFKEKEPVKERSNPDVIRIGKKVSYSREEQNVLLLDIAQFSVNGGEFNPYDEIVRIDDILRKKFNYPKSDGQDIQPWAMQEGEKHFVDLKFNILSECCVKDAFLAAEEIISASLNDKEISLEDSGWYFDKSIRKYPISEIPKGESCLCVRVPFSKSISLENMFILGEFDVRLEGSIATIIPKSEKIAFGSITTQGMPFYGGNLTYHTELKTPDCDLTINVSGFKGSLVKVYIDGEDKGVIALSPYELKIPALSAGEHKIDIKLFGNRYNTFAALHNCSDMTWAGPSMWYPKKSDWCEEYNLKESGVIKSPVFTIEMR